MAYAATFINRHVQFGKCNVELTLTDAAGLYPNYRQWMKFAASVTDQQLADAAALHITRVIADLAQYEAEQIILEARPFSSLRFQTKLEFADKLRQAFKSSSRERSATIANWILVHLAAGDFTDLQLRNAFGLTAGQWTTLKTKLQALADNYNAVQTAQGE